MVVTITGRRLSVPEPLRKKIDEKLGRLNKLLREIQEARVIFSRQKLTKSAEVVIYAKDLTLAGEAKGEDLEAAFNLVLDKLRRQFNFRFRHSKAPRRTHGPRMGCLAYGRGF